MSKMVWEEFYRQCRQEKDLTRLRNAYIKIRKWELREAGCNYGEAVWYAVMESKKLFRDKIETGEKQDEV